MYDSDSDEDLPHEMMHEPELEHLTKATKKTKSKSLARRIIEKVPDALLQTANLARATGYVTNPYISAGLTAANLLKSHGHHLFGKKKTDYAVSGLAGAAAAPAVYKKIKELRDPKKGPALLQLLQHVPLPAF
jgi:hypothetical protein